MTKKTRIYDFERCEASLSTGRRCPNYAGEAVFNPGAPFPYQVCGTHKRQGERSVASSGALPEIWDRWS